MMHFTLTNESLYAEIREWFEANKQGFPKTLDGYTMYFGDVVFQVEVWIYQIDTVLSRSTKINETAKQAKRNLFQIYRDLQVKENWNVPMKQLGEL